MRKERRELAAAATAREPLVDDEAAKPVNPSDIRQTPILQGARGAEACWDQLLRLRDWDGLAVGGPFTVSIHERNGQIRLNCSIVAERLILPRQNYQASVNPGKPGSAIRRECEQQHQYAEEMR